MALVADIFKVLLVDPKTNEAFASGTFESANLKIENPTTEVEGGGGLVAVLHSPKKESIELKDVCFHFDILAKQLGADLVVGADEAYAFPREYRVVKTGADKTIDLVHAPKNPASVKITDASGVALQVSTDYTLTGNKVTITKSGIDAGHFVNVGVYTYETDADTESFIIDNAKYPTGVMCVLQTMEISEDETPMNTIQIVFDNCVFDGDITIDTQSKRDASRHNINLKVVNKLGESTVAGRVLRIPLA